MARIEVSTFIAAPPEAVWDVLADIAGQGAWMVDVRSIAFEGEQRSGAGTVIRVTSDLFGRPVVRDVMAFTAWEPPARMDVEHRGAFHGTGRFAIERAHNGSIFTWTEDFAAPLGLIGEAAVALIVKPHLARVFARSLANLRRIAEERYAAATSGTPA